MNPGLHNLSPARRARRCALSLLAFFSVATAATFLARLDDTAPAPDEKSMASTAGPATVRSDTVIARGDERL